MLFSAQIKSFLSLLNELFALLFESAAAEKSYSALCWALVLQTQTPPLIILLYSSPRHLLVEPQQRSRQSILLKSDAAQLRMFGEIDLS